MEIDRTFLSRSSDVYKHQVLGFTSDMEEISINGTTANNNTSMSLDHYFPKLKESLECGRRKEHQQLQLQLHRQVGEIKEIDDDDISHSKSNEGGGSESRGRNKKKNRRNANAVRRRRIRSREFRLRNRDPDFFLPSYSGGGGGAGGISYRMDFAICHDWHTVASQRIASLTRALDAASAVIQSPLLPEESE